MDEKNENECENEEKAGDKSSLSLCFHSAFVTTKVEKSNFYKDLDGLQTMLFNRCETNSSVAKIAEP